MGIYVTLKPASCKYTEVVIDFQNLLLIFCTIYNRLHSVVVYMFTYMQISAFYFYSHFTHYHTFCISCVKVSIVFLSMMNL